MRIAKDLIENSRGSFAIISAVVMFGLVAAGALAIDVTHIMRYRSLLTDAADNAVLAAVSEGSRARKNAYTLDVNGEIPNGKEDIENLFKINFIDVPQHDLQFTQVNASVKRDGFRVLANLRYTARVRTYFGSILGLEFVDLDSASAAAWAATTVADYYLVLDNSGSMGVGATPADITYMVAHGGCQFACHISPTSPRYQNENSLPEFRELGVTLRFDVVKEASENLLHSVEKVRFFIDQFRMALYDFGLIGNAQSLNELQPLTNSLQDARQALNLSDIMMYEDNYAGRQTDFQARLAELNQLIPDAETGPNGSKRQQYVFLVSDGVQSSPPLGPNGHCRWFDSGPGYAPWNIRRSNCLAPIDPAWCEPIKARGIKIVALYTTYDSIITPNYQWEEWMSKWAGPNATDGIDKVSRDMKRCASENLFFAVGPGQGISEAMEELFRRTLTDKPTLLP